jgi:murein DD-endopeptidase MepM/ murein hydrolase activator NlpD
MEHYTVILMPADASAVRQFQVHVPSLRRVAGAALVAALVLAAIAADWVRLRRDAVDVDRLRVEAAERHEALQLYTEQMRLYSEKVGAVEAQLAALREFERRVRVIANLPGAAAGPSGEEAALALGVGGGADDPAHATPPIGAPTGANAGGAEPQEVGPAQAPPAAAAPVSSTEPLAPAQWARIQARPVQLARQALRQQDSLRSLIELIRGKAERLASTPSIWPAKGWLTSRFGYRISPFTGLRDFHAGIDIAAEPGTEVVASARGRVVFAGPKGSLGKVAILEHGFGIRTTYGHAQEVLVRPGQAVERGQVIASVGSSGRSTGPHLHYAVERDGRTANPIDYIVE